MTTFSCVPRPLPYGPRNAAVARLEQENAFDVVRD